jgi:hypothetical protein
MVTVVGWQPWALTGIECSDCRGGLGRDAEAVDASVCIKAVAVPSSGYADVRPSLIASLMTERSAGLKPSCMMPIGV